MAKIIKNIAGLRMRPAFLYDNIPVVFSTDDFYAPVLGVLLKSICETKSENKCFDFIVLHNNLAPQRISSLFTVVQGYEAVSLRFVNVSQYIRGENLYTANRPNLSRESYFRLLIPDLFIHYEKMLYLDCDMIAVKDISLLFDIDIGNCCIAAVRDYFNTKILSYDNKKLEEDLGSPQLFQAHKNGSYINSGLVLFNLNQIRREFSPGILWKTALEKPWHIHDQDVLNHVFLGDIYFLHASWNYCDVILLSDDFTSFPEERQNEIIESKDSVGIVHYLFPYRKPWQYVTHYSIVYFWPVAVRTLFYKELLQRQLKFVEDIVIVKSSKEFDNKVRDYDNEGTGYDINKITSYEICLSQQRLILQSMLQNKELEYRLQGKDEGYSCRRLQVLAKTDGNVDKIRRVTPKRVLSFEFSVCGHCNLGCKGCAHFAPLVEEDFADFEESDRAFKQLGQLFGGEAESIHLLGGEPLLHPSITDFMQSVRKHFPIGKIEIVTNGLLLPRMNDDFWRNCKENKIQISVTKYPLEFDYITVQALAAYHGVDFDYYGSSDLFGINFYNLALNLTGEQDPDDSFLNCDIANSCITLKNGRIYPCSIAPNMRYFAQRFGMLNLSADDSIDIFSAKDKDEILDFVSLPISLCRYCAPQNHVAIEEWGISERRIEEWTL